MTQQPTNDYTNDFDVAIIGYGPVGVTAANLLGARGLRVLVAERDASVYARARAISTDEEVLRVWQRVGLAERLEQDMLPDRPIDFVDDRGASFIHFTAPSRGNGHAPQQFIYQPALEQTLRDGVDRYPHVTVLLEHECVRFRQDPDGVALTLVDARTDTLRRIRARYVIAADGGSSPTRGQLGISFEGRTYEDRWVVIDTKVKHEWPDVDRLRFHCDPARPAVDCPTPLGHHRWEYPVLAGDDEAELVTDEHVWRLLDRQGIGPDHVELLRAVVYNHHVRFAARWRVGRIFLAGDAAHAMPPWIGQGMASGVRDVNNLCWKLAGVLDGTLPETVLDTYEAERKPHVKATTRNAVLVGRLITERRTWACTLRNHVFGTLSKIRPLNRRLGASVWVPPSRYRTGLLGQTNAGSTRSSRSTKALTGTVLPQPTITHGGSTTLLDDALGDGWAVLTDGTHDGTHDGAGAWAAAGARVLRVARPGTPADSATLTDDDGVLLAWLRKHHAAAVVVRPDGIVYAAAASGDQLPAPILRAAKPTPVAV